MKIEDVIKHFRGRGFEYCADYLEQHAAEIAPAPTVRITCPVCGQPHEGTACRQPLPEGIPVVSDIKVVYADSRDVRIAEFEAEEVEKFICASCGREGQHFAFCEDEDICWPCGWDLFIKPRITELEAALRLITAALSGQDVDLAAIPPIMPDEMTQLAMAIQQLLVTGTMPKIPFPDLRKDKHRIAALEAVVGELCGALEEEATYACTHSCVLSSIDVCKDDKCRVETKAALTRARAALEGAAPPAAEKEADCAE